MIEHSKMLSFFYYEQKMFPEEKNKNNSMVSFIKKNRNKNKIEIPKKSLIIKIKFVVIYFLN